MKLLPRGTYLIFRHLAPALTEEAFQEFLAARGLAIPIERISVNNYSSNSSALVAFSREHMNQLVAWAINGEKLNGKPVKPELFNIGQQIEP